MESHDDIFKLQGMGCSAVEPIGSFASSKLSPVGVSFAERILAIPEGGGFRMSDYWVWCGSVIRDDAGLYHMFASRWSKKAPMFTGYVLSSEIVRAVSKTPEGPYHFVEKVLPSGRMDSWDGRMAHNPSIHKWNGTYLLYYIGSTFEGEMKIPDDNAPTIQTAESYANIRIGLATAPSPCGPWTPRSEPILKPRPGKWDDQLVTNPAPCIRDDGRVILFYRSNTPEGLRIGIAGAKSFGGPYERLSDGPVLRFPSGDFVEDPYVWWAGDHYEMLAKDMLGGITGEVHAGAHFRSPDGFDWSPMEPAKAYSRELTFENGKTVRLGCLERPQLLLDEQASPLCLFAAAADGPGGFTNAENTWNIAIPLQCQKHP